MQRCAYAYKLKRQTFDFAIRFNFKQSEQSPWGYPFCTFQFAYAFLEFSSPFQGRFISQSIPFWGEVQC
jgi:hypothetical protein